VQSPHQLHGRLVGINGRQQPIYHQLVPLTGGLGPSTPLRCLLAAAWGMVAVHSLLCCLAEVCFVAGAALLVVLLLLLIRLVLGGILMALILACTAIRLLAVAPVGALASIAARTPAALVVRILLLLLLLLLLVALVVVLLLLVTPSCICCLGATQRVEALMELQGLQQQVVALLACLGAGTGSGHGAVCQQPRG
jgi:hypothetical protein